ncbi:universal stress protein [Rhodoligotrophos ferricapiens]|uniref:universal stress protein n=1 Tax=Rhodoligotrophos ferricapiens TaxID=3069264 RepID=UPI00315D861D
MFKNILVAVDLAEVERSQETLEAAAEQAKSSNGMVHVVYIRPMLIEAVLEYLPENYYSEEERTSLAALQDMADKAGLPRDRVSFSCPIGSAYEKVLEAAREHNADLIVVGAHRTGMTGFLLGSNAARVVRHAPCSVLVAR